MPAKRKQSLPARERSHSLGGEEGEEVKLQERVVFQIEIWKPENRKFLLLISPGLGCKQLHFHVIPITHDVQIDSVRHKRLLYGGCGFHRVEIQQTRNEERVEFIGAVCIPFQPPINYGHAPPPVLEDVSGRSR